MRIDRSTVISALLPVLVRAWIESEPGGEFGRYNVGNANLPLALAHQLDQLAGKRAVGVSQLLERRVVVAARQFSIGAGKAVQAAWIQHNCGRSANFPRGASNRI